MTFEQENTSHFLNIFEKSKSLIRNFPGCMHLELLQDIKEPNIYLTYSHWSDEASLEIYRQSDLFKTTWAQTKILFAKKAEAISLFKVTEVA
jgi:quinol monooxygenase YgiN